MGRDSGSKSDDFTYTSLHTRPTSFPGSFPTHPLGGRIGVVPGNEVAHLFCI